MGLRQHINNSGFPLQLAIANKFPRTNSGWHVIYQEHEWSQRDTTGFIDLVLEDRYKTWVMNVECKRVRDTSWMFLRDKSTPPRRRHAKLWVSKKRDEEILAQFGWVDIPMDPACEESTFCVVPGQDARARPMLERIASEVVLSTEALAAEEAERLSARYSNLRIYQNVIVTTAELKVCEVDIDQIDIATGEIGVDSVFVDVPYVRFRKQLGSTLRDSEQAQDDYRLRNMIRQKESTIFIVNSEYFENFVSACELPDNIGQHIHAR